LFPSWITTSLYKISFESGSTGRFGAGVFVCAKQIPEIMNKNRKLKIALIVFIEFEITTQY
jgi:hypothetical protein